MCLFSCVFYRVNELYVDDPDKDSGGKIDVSLNISLPNLHCDCEYIHKIHKYSSEWCFSIHMCITSSSFADMLWVVLFFWALEQWVYCWYVILICWRRLWWETMHNGLPHMKVSVWDMYCVPFLTGGLG